MSRRDWVITAVAAMFVIGLGAFAVIMCMAASRHSAKVGVAGFVAVALVGVPVLAVLGPPRWFGPR